VHQKNWNFGATTTGYIIMTTCLPTSLKTTEFVSNSNMVIGPHPPYSPVLVPCDFTWFPKLKMKLKGRCFETKGKALRKMTSIVLLKHGKNDRIAVYIPKETTLKEMAAKTE
jgi:hypothetical protein